MDAPDETHGPTARAEHPGRCAAPDPLARILLRTDGTVTHILEAYTGEPIHVVIVWQRLQPCGRREPDLDVGPDEAVLRRSVVLRGSHSDTAYVDAESLVVVDRLPSGLREALRTTREPIGRLLRHHRLETFREVVATGRERAGARGVRFDVEPWATILCRTYHILWRQRPVMRITERFPAGRAAGSPGLGCAHGGCPLGGSGGEGPCARLHRSGTCA